MVHRFGWLLLPLVLAGCVGPTQPCIDGVVCDLARLPRDASVTGQPVAATSLPPEKAGAKTPLLDRLIIPRDLPGADVPKLDLPPYEKENEAKRAEALRKLYPGLPEVGSEVVLAPGPDGQPLTLSQLQTLALSNSPVLRRAVARVEAARGAAVQAGLPPNPTVGYVANTVGTGRSAGQIGPYIDQVVPLGNKLQLARAVAALDLRRAEIEQRKTEMDLLTSVRRGFFKVIVAQESVRVLRALEGMIARAHSVQVEQLVKGVEVAPYEPLQTRVQTTQARAALVQARHQLLAAWKQLAATVGLPGLPPTELAGNLQEMPLPLYEHAPVLDHVLKHHTDLLSAEAGILRARHAVAQAKASNIPDMEVQIQLTPDYSTVNNPITPTVQVGFQGLPVWHRNHGAIAQAEAELSAADEAMPQARNDLTARLADAFNRYAAHRAQVVLLRDGALPDLVRAYRAIRDRYLTEPSAPDSSQPNFQDVINAQQNVVQMLGTYLSNLDGFTTALVDVADLLQTDDLYLLASERCCLGPIGLDLVEECRPCSPLDARAFQKPAAGWPVSQPTLAAPAAEKPVPRKEEPLHAPRPARLPDADEGK